MFSGRLIAASSAACPGYLSSTTGVITDPINVGGRPLHSCLVHHVTSADDSVWRISGRWNVGANGLASAVPSVFMCRISKLRKRIFCGVRQ